MLNNSAMKIKSPGFTALFVLAAMSLLPSNASAEVVNGLSLSDSEIFQGNSVTEYATLSVSPSAGYNNAFFVGGTITLNPGGGNAPQTFTILPNLSSETFQATVSYVTPGNYAPSASFNASFDQQAQVYGVLYYTSVPETGSYWVQDGCIFGSCWGHWQTYTYYVSQPVYGYYEQTFGPLVDSQTITSSLTVDALTAPVLTTAVPEPSTWAMIILGFLGIGSMAYRRKPKMVVAAA
jgi:PEP-CTERM motif-containing protein